MARGGFRSNTIPTKDNPNLVPIGGGQPWGGAAAANTNVGGAAASKQSQSAQQINFINSLVAAPQSQRLAANGGSGGSRHAIDPSKTIATSQ